MRPVRLRRWLASLATALRPFRAETVDVYPDRFQKHRVYLVGDEQLPRMAAFLCPCACGKVVCVRLEGQGDANRSLRLRRNGAVSLAPSTGQAAGGCGDFLIRNGRVVWI